LQQLLIGIQEAAAAIGLSPWTVRQYVRNGRIRGVKIGRRVLIEPRELERLVESGQIGAENGEPGEVVKGRIK
jgi:excisionase family DNA binding protein